MKTITEHKAWIISEAQKFAKEGVPIDWLTIHMTKEMEDIYQYSNETNALGESLESLVSRLKEENIREVFHHLLGAKVKRDAPELKVTRET